MAREKKPSKGSVAFAALMPNHGDQALMAKELGESGDQVSRWASGAGKPPPAVRLSLERKYEIPYASWDLPPSKAFDRAVLRGRARTATG